MGKCQWIINKGKRVNEECGIYTKKENNGNFYCSSHLKMTESKAEPVTLKKSKTIKKVVKKIPEKETSIDESESSKSSSDEDEDEIVEEIKDKTFFTPTKKSLEEKIEEDFAKKKHIKKNIYVNRNEFMNLKKKVIYLYKTLLKSKKEKKTTDNENESENDEPKLETFN